MQKSLLFPKTFLFVAFLLLLFATNNTNLSAEASYTGWIMIDGKTYHVKITASWMNGYGDNQLDLYPP